MDRPAPRTPRERLEYRAARALAALPPRAQVRLSRRPPVTVDGQTLEPEIQLTLAMLERQGLPPMETLGAVEARRQVARQTAAIAGPPLPVGAVRDLHVDGAEGSLDARLYTPQEMGGPHPLLVFFHGGGFVIGDLDTHDAVCRMLCRHAGVHVLSVAYRLAPEHPFPAPVDDCLAATRWALSHAQELGADPRRVAVGGDSAGGNLAAVVSHVLVRAGEDAPVFQLLLYPAVDVAGSHPSQELFANGFFLTEAQMEWFKDQYVGSADPEDPRLSVLRAEDLSGLPPALVVTAGFDPLRDEGEAYALALRQAGNLVAVRRFSGLIHGFANAATVSRVSRDALIEVAGATRALLATVVADAPLRDEVPGASVAGAPD
ncbi:alpha/beta hydrolase [Paraconexibacter sp.]|uniref:alpha/beta hydrolase n=1 Tax=Paraconexibacter sp. TaxID=2949640 RepID=UPI0035659D8C